MNVRLGGRQVRPRRAYELRQELPGANQRLLDYVSNGGTLVVQYQRDFAWDKVQYAPYPAKIASDKPNSPLPRITDENATVKFLKPDDPLLNRPNKITPEDFTGWIQERGLYFWTQFDAKYTPLLAMNDPGESGAERRPGVYARTEKELTSTPGWRFSGNCRKACRARTVCSLICSVRRAKPDETRLSPLLPQP